MQPTVLNFLALALVTESLGDTAPDTSLEVSSDTDTTPTNLCMHVYVVYIELNVCEILLIDSIVAIVKNS